LHWADNGTAAALRSLPKRLAGVPIGWMLSTRGGQGSPQVAAHWPISSRTGRRKIVLDVLSPDAVEQVVTDLLAAVPDADLLRWPNGLAVTRFCWSSWSEGWPRSTLS